MDAWIMDTWMCTMSIYLCTYVYIYVYERLQRKQVLLSPPPPNFCIKIQSEVFRPHLRACPLSFVDKPHVRKDFQKVIPMADGVCI